jgi:hypothetical protein
VVFAATALNTPTLENGSYFYFTRRPIHRFRPEFHNQPSSADVENSGPCDAGNGDLRLSWHLSGSVDGGLDVQRS